jgi:hypothetical protein
MYLYTCTYGGGTPQMVEWLGYGMEMLEASVFDSHQRQDSFLHSAQTGSGVQIVSYPMGTRYSFREGRVAEAWSC